jgi:hypothetical protein
MSVGAIVCFYVRCPSSFETRDILTSHALNVIAQNRISGFDRVVYLYSPSLVRINSRNALEGCRSCFGSDWLTSCRQPLAVRFRAQTPLHRTISRARITPHNLHRCGQPGQQHGRRIPSLSSEHTLSTCCRLVSSFLTEMVQHIHSLRASGVMSSQAASALASDASASRRSAGRLCTTPLEIRTVVIALSRSLSDQEIADH